MVPEITQAGNGQMEEDHFSTSALTSASAFVLTWAMPRCRLPADAVLLICAAMAMGRLLERANVRALERV